MTVRIRVNAAECAQCGDTITSEHRLDWQQCGCGAIFVDSGQAYLRRGGDLASVIDRSVMDDDGVTKL